MDTEREKILEMLAQGAISAGEAAELLAALDGVSLENSLAAPEVPVIEGEIITPPEAPDTGRYRRYWLLPFFLSLAVLLVSGIGVGALLRTEAGVFSLGVLCLSSLLLLAAVTLALSWLSRYVPWLHVRVQEKTGRRFAISFPLPLGLTRWALNFARRVVDNAEARRQLDNAEAMIVAMRANTTGRLEPITLSINDDDGDYVRIFIG